MKLYFLLHQRLKVLTVESPCKIKAGCWTKLQTYRSWSWFFLPCLVNPWTAQHLFLCHNGTEGTQPCKASHLDCSTNTTLLCIPIVSPSDSQQHLQRESLQSFSDNCLWHSYCVVSSWLTYVTKKIAQSDGGASCLPKITRKGTGATPCPPPRSPLCSDGVRHQLQEKLRVSA